MKLYDYMSLTPDMKEITVWDNDYDIETYFYGGSPKDEWDTAIIELSKLLTVKRIENAGITVNFSEVIESRMEKLEAANLFIDCDIDLIMDNLNAIIAGNVSEEWLKEFVAALK